VVWLTKNTLIIAGTIFDEATLKNDDKKSVLDGC